MPSSLQQAADGLTETAGWKQAVPDGNGVFHFSLEGDLSFELLTPDNRTGFFLADLGALPSARDEAEALLKRLASLAVGCLKKRRSVLSLAEGHLRLYRSFRLNGLSGSALRQTMPHDAKDFLNDLAWWQKQLSSSHVAGTTASPFSFGGNTWLSGAFSH